MLEMVSVIMCTYNEPIEVIDASIKSILNQSYENIQLIIINDNPDRLEMAKYLNDLSVNNHMVEYIKNEKNIGLVRSLNRGLLKVKGEYIARMDADDISNTNRIKEQVTFLKKNNCDIVGSNVITIDEDNNIIGKIIVPTKHKDILKFYNYGSCMLHPTWLGKRNVFENLNGYRNIYSCEDYDFIIRAIEKGYHLGNVPDFLLKYRVRNSGISVSSEAQQRLTRYFIKKNRDNINELSISDFELFLNSKFYKKELAKINKYIEIKNSFKKSKQIKFINMISLIFNKYFYISIRDTMKAKHRKKYSL